MLRNNPSLRNRLLALALVLALVLSLLPGCGHKAVDMGDKTARDTWTTLTHEEKTCILDALKRLAFIVVSESKYIR